MNAIDILWKAAQPGARRALPILSFPAVARMGVTVEDLVKSAELQAQAMAVIARETDTPAAISLMDLSVEAEAFGASVRFHVDEVPAVTGCLIEDLEGAQALAVPDPALGRTGLCAQAIALAKARIKDKPVLAGIIGPFSLAGRLMDVTEIMYACYDEPETVHLVLEKATAFLIAYGRNLIRAGADGIVMAEPLAGILSPDLMEEFSAPYVAQLVQALQTGDCCLIYHNCGNSVPQMLDHIFAQGAAACHFGNAVDMDKVFEKAPEDVLCMGNIDPAGQFTHGTPESIAHATLDLLARYGHRKNFVISSGCDIPANAPWDNINAFFQAVAKHNKEGQTP